MRPARAKKLRDLALAAVFSVGIVWSLSLVWGIYGKQERARQAVAEAADELAAIEARRETLALDLAALQTERGQEALMRGTLGVARPGEEVIIVVPGEEVFVPSRVPWWKRALQMVGL